MATDVIVKLTPFQRDLVEKGLIPLGHDPRHFEAYIRLAHSTVNQLSWAEIRCECKIALACISASTLDEVEAFTKSFGL